MYAAEYTEEYVLKKFQVPSRIRKSVYEIEDESNIHNKALDFINKQND